MVLIYNIAISFYHFLIWLASFWNEKAKKWIQGRREIQKDIEKIKTTENKIAWFHCASVGEYEQALPLIQRAKEQYTILTTFYSPSGYEYAKKKYPDDYFSYLPADNSSSVKKFIDSVHPAMVIVIKYEFWYHLMNELYLKKIPVFVVSAVFRNEQIFFRSWGFFFRNILKKITHFYVQDEKSKLLLNSINLHNATVTGDTRFDRVLENKNATYEDEKITQFISGKKIFIAGSAWDSDIPVLKKIISLLSEDWKIIIAPHEMDHFSLQWITHSFVKYSDFHDSDADKRIMIIDTIGLLSKLYRFGNFAYVGGGFGKGIHNILEPAVYEIPVLIGPEYKKFLEAVLLTEKGYVFCINEKTAGKIIQEIIFDEKKYKLISAGLKDYIVRNTNLSDKIWVYINGC